MQCVGRDTGSAYIYITFQGYPSPILPSQILTNTAILVLDNLFMH